MPDLDFSVAGARAVPYAIAPTLAFELRVSSPDREEEIHDVLLDCQVRIEAQRRRYRGAERGRLFEIFGEPSRWSQTLRSLLWAHASVRVPPFRGSALVDLHVPCTFDFNVQVAKYFDALEEGLVPVLLLFSGSVFYAGAEGALQVARISWSKEAAYDLPVEVWKEVIRLYYPNSAWLNIAKDVFDRLAAYKAAEGLITWESTLESLLERASSSQRTGCR